MSTEQVEEYGGLSEYFVKRHPGTIYKQFDLCNILHNILLGFNPRPSKSKVL